MSNKFVVVVFLCYIFNEIDIFANPIDIRNPNQTVFLNQLFNNSNLLPYQSVALKENPNPSGARKKRFLDDFFNILDYIISEDEDDDDESSSEEDGNDEEVEKGKYDLCHNCTVNFNKMNQVQHIYHHHAPPSNSTLANNNNKIENKESSNSSTTEQSLQPPITKQGETFETTTTAIPANTEAIPTNTAVVLPTVTEITNDKSADKATTIKTEAESANTEKSEDPATVNTAVVLPTVTEITNDESADKATTIKTEAESVKIEDSK